MVEYRGHTEGDAMLTAWVRSQPWGDSVVIVEHAPRSDAKVSGSDLVNTQVFLADGRLVRVHHVSPQSKEDSCLKVVLAEADSPESLEEAEAEKRARACGWITIDEAGWDGSLICHKDHSDTREGPEYASWRECVAAQSALGLVGKAHP